jgi:SAM-dependent methyltransferase
MDRLLELTRRAERDHFWFRGFRAFMAPVLVQAMQGRPRGRVLDCGCGTGVNLPLLAPYGTAVGCDITWRGLTFARQDAARVLQGSVAQLPFGDGVFDLVASFDVFSALPDRVEQDGIREVARVLKPGGAAVLTVAALDVLHGAHSRLACETRRYTPARLRALMSAGGLVPERLTFTHATIFPLVLAARLADRLRGASSAPTDDEWELAIPPAPVNAALTAALTVEAALLRILNMPIGSSLVCVARKPQ